MSTSMRQMSRFFQTGMVSRLKTLKTKETKQNRKALLRPEDNGMTLLFKLSTSPQNWSVQQGKYREPTEPSKRDSGLILKNMAKNLKPGTSHHKLVIFDKNGTLINFHNVWTPWVQNLAKRLDAATGLSVEDALFEQLAVCKFTKRTKAGVLAQGTTWEIKLKIEDVLCSLGLNRRKAQVLVEECWEDCDISDPQLMKSIGDIHKLFRELKAQEIKIAICTSDTRKSTINTLQKLELMSYIDKLVCGDDFNMITKPCSVNVTSICQELAIQPSETVVVGDTLADMNMGRSGNANLNIGVLTGIGTRLELSRRADFVVDSVVDALPLILGTKGTPIVKSIRPEDSFSQRKASLVIFDKDGTLICFHSMWTPWAKSLVKRLEDATRLELSKKIFTGLGYCHKTEAWRPGLLAEGTTVQNKNRVQEMLVEEGLSALDAEDVMKKVWTDVDHQKKEYLKTLHNLKTMFKTLKKNGVKIAICTADSRHATEAFVKELGLKDYVDMLVCGDDEDSEPKPSPYNALKICTALNINPDEAVMVGDTKADMGMGRSAQLGATVGVLSGVGRVDDLENKADHILPSIKNLMPILLENGSKSSEDFAEEE